MFIWLLRIPDVFEGVFQCFPVMFQGILRFLLFAEVFCCLAILGLLVFFFQVSFWQIQVVVWGGWGVVKS